MKPILPLALLLACASCKSPSSTTPDASTLKTPDVADENLNRVATIGALTETIDRVLRQLPAARDDAQALIKNLADVKAKLGDAEVKKRMAPWAGTNVPRGALSQQAFNTLVAYLQKSKSAGLDVATDGDASMAQLQERVKMLKMAIVLLEEVDKAHFEYAILTGADAGFPVEKKP